MATHTNLTWPIPLAWAYQPQCQHDLDVLSQSAVTGCGLSSNIVQCAPTAQTSDRKGELMAGNPSYGRFVTWEIGLVLSADAM
jgi:hypothetical protein